MVSDSTILKHIALQPKRSAGFKQLVRELGLHGAARGELDAQLAKAGRGGTTGSAEFRSLRFAASRSRQESGGRTV